MQTWLSQTTEESEFDTQTGQATFLQSVRTDSWDPRRSWNCDPPRSPPSSFYCTAPLHLWFLLKVQGCLLIEFPVRLGKAKTLFCKFGYGIRQCKTRLNASMSRGTHVTMWRVSASVHPSQSTSKHLPILPPSPHTVCCTSS